MCLILHHHTFSFYSDEEVLEGLNQADLEMEYYADRELDLDIYEYLGGEFPAFLKYCEERNSSRAMREYFTLLLEYEYRKFYRE